MGYIEGQLLQILQSATAQYIRQLFSLVCFMKNEKPSCECVLTLSRTFEPALLIKIRKVTT